MDSGVPLFFYTLAGNVAHSSHRKNLKNWKSTNHHGCNWNTQDIKWWYDWIWYIYIYVNIYICEYIYIQYITNIYIYIYILCITNVIWYGCVQEWEILKTQSCVFSSKGKMMVNHDLNSSITGKGLTGTQAWTSSLEVPDGKDVLVFVFLWFW